MSIMVNFRLKSKESLQALDSIAKTIGMNRSTFIRTAVEEKMMTVSAAPRPVPAGGRQERPTVSEGPKVRPEDCAHKKTSRTTFGIKICQDCGARIAS